MTTRVDDGFTEIRRSEKTQLIWVSISHDLGTRVSSVFGGWPWIMTWSSWDCAMGCHAKSSGPRGMEKAKKFRLAEFWDPRIFWQPQTCGYI